MRIKNPLLISLTGIFLTSLFVTASANAYEFPPYEGLSLKIEGNVTESYSNNITFAKNREDRIETFLTLLKIGMNMKYDGKRRSINFQGDIIRRIKTQKSDIQESSEKLSLGFSNDFSKYDSLSISNSYAHTQSPETFEEEFGRIAGRFDYYSNQVNINYNKSLHKKVSFNANYLNGLNWSSYEGTRDSTRNEFRFIGNYSYHESITFFTSYRYANSKFKGGTDISINTANAGVSYYITRRLHFNGQVGVVFAPQSTSNSIQALITDELDRLTTAKISYTKIADISAITENVFRSWRVTGQLDRKFSEDFHSSISAFYGEGEYEPEREQDSLAGLSAKLNYSFWKNKKGARLTGGLGCTYSNLSSTEESRGYDRTTINSRLSLIF